jgi:hypothetical protein
VGTHYETLGVRPDADQATVRAAYLAKARTHHPDRHVDAPPAERARSARTMREVNAAWAVLSDAAARRRYDASLAAARAPSPGTGAGAATATSAPRPTRPAAGPTAAPNERVGGPTGSDATADVDLVGRGIRVIPVLGLLAVLLGIFVFTAFAATSREAPPTTTATPVDLAAGSCVRAARFAVVSCREAHDAVVVSVVDIGRPCPTGTSVYTIAPRRVACLRPLR